MPPALCSASARSPAGRRPRARAGSSTGPAEAVVQVGRLLVLLRRALGQRAGAIRVVAGEELHAVVGGVVAEAHHDRARLVREHLPQHDVDAAEQRVHRARRRSLDRAPAARSRRGTGPTARRSKRAAGPSLTAAGRGASGPAPARAHQLVRALRPVAQQRARVARVDDLLDPEALRGAERRAHRVQPRLDLGAQRDRVLGRLELAPVGGLEPALDRQRAPVARRPRVAQVQAARRCRAPRPRRRRPCAPAPRPTARSPGRRRTARACRAGSCPRARPRCRSRSRAGRRS